MERATQCGEERNEDTLRDFLAGAELGFVSERHFDMRVAAQYICLWHTNGIGQGHWGRDGFSGELGLVSARRAWDLLCYYSSNEEYPPPLR